jgi:hypothetical protein
MEVCYNFWPRSFTGSTQGSFYNPRPGLQRLLLCWTNHPERRVQLVQVQHRRVLTHERLRCLPRRHLVLVRLLPLHLHAYPYYYDDDL